MQKESQEIEKLNNNELMEQILDNIKTASKINRYDLIARELVKVFSAGRKDSIEEIKDLTPTETPQIVFPHSVTAQECYEVSRLVNQEGFDDGFMMCLEGQMGLYDLIEDGYED